MKDDMKPCPNCPDGNEWRADGPTGRPCPICNGYATVRMDGESFTAEEWRKMHGEEDA